MEVKRKLQKISGSAALTILAEMARELSLSPGDEVWVRSEGGRMVVEPVSPGPRPEVVGFMARFMDEYEVDPRSLADR